MVERCRLHTGELVAAPNSVEATGPTEIGAPWRVNRLQTSITPLIGTTALSDGGGSAIAMNWVQPS